MQQNVILKDQELRARGSTVLNLHVRRVMGYGSILGPMGHPAHVIVERIGRLRRNLPGEKSRNQHYYKDAGQQDPLQPITDQPDFRNAQPEPTAPNSEETTPNNEGREGPHEAEACD